MITTNKEKNKFIIFVAIFVILFGRNVYAKENNDGIIKILDDFAIYHNSEIALYNAEDECIGFYYEGVNDGYVIIDTYGEIIEFSYENEIQAYENAENNCYYAGPGEYYMESENNENILVNITTNKNIKKNEVNSFKNITSNENIDKKTSITITYPDSTKDSEGNTTYTGYYKSLTLEKKMNLPCETRYLDYNNDNTCGSLATAIMFYYYYDYINRSYIKSDKYIGTGYVRQKAFYDSFKPLLGDNGDGTSYTQVKNGINKYLKSIEKNPTCTYITTANLLYNVTSKIIDCIENRKPCIVGLSNEPKYGNHWVVGVGYARYQAVDDWDLINIDFIKINNGWYTTKSHSIVYVNSMYVDGLIYLK